MNYDQTPLPMRAWLSEDTPYIVENEWLTVEECPLPCDALLQLIKLPDGAKCFAVNARGLIFKDIGEDIDDDFDECRLVSLLSPADPVALLAIKTWESTWGVRVRMEGRGGGAGTIMSRTEFAILAKEWRFDTSFACDRVAAAIAGLSRQGRLAQAVAEALGTKQPVWCAVVETPMMLESMRRFGLDASTN